MEQEDLDCESPPAKKKKKRDKVTADQDSDHRAEASDMNGNSNVETSPKKKTKKNSEENTKVRAFSLLHFLNLVSDLCCCHGSFHFACKIVTTFICVTEEYTEARESND